MTYNEVLAAARALPSGDRLTLVHVLVADVSAERVATPGAGSGHYLSAPCPENGWKWEPSPELLAEMQRLHDNHKLREAS